MGLRLSPKSRTYGATSGPVGLDLDRGQLRISRCRASGVQSPYSSPTVAGLALACNRLHRGPCRACGLDLRVLHAWFGRIPASMIPTLRGPISPDVGRPSGTVDSSSSLAAWGRASPCIEFLAAPTGVHRKGGRTGCPNEGRKALLDKDRMQRDPAAVAVLGGTRLRGYMGDPKRVLLHDVFSS